MKLAESLFRYNFKEGDVIVRKGEAGETMFIIKEGYIRGTDISVGTTDYADVRLGPGDFFGERCIVTGEAYIGTATAATDGTAWTLTKERFLHTVGHLNLKELVIKSQAKKLLVRSLSIDCVLLLLLSRMVTLSRTMLRIFHSPDGHSFVRPLGH
jgi:CRP-like cAMP-binding protein